MRVTDDRASMVRLVRGVLAERANLAVDAERIPVDADLFSSGLTSLDAVGVMLDLEARLELELPDELVSRDAFRSIEAIVGTVERARALLRHQSPA